MKKIKWKTGAGELIGYTVSMVFLCYLLIIIIGFMILNTNYSALENVSSVIARDVVVCTSLEDARMLAQSEAERYLQQYDSISEVKAEVDYTAGSDNDWLKGNFVTVTISGYIRTCEPFTSGKRYSVATVMIENNGGA